MSTETLQLDPALQAYLHQHALREPPPCRRLREHPRTQQELHLATAPEQVQLLALLRRLMGARRVLEVGTFTGYTALWLALELPETGSILCLDHDAEVGAVARAAWEEAGVDDRIELRVGDAKERLATLFDEGEASTFDFAYIDADKEPLADYFEACLKLVRPGGLVAVDNVLWKGRVAEPEADDAATEAVRAFNRSLHGDDRIDLSLVPIGDGLTLARRRDEAGLDAG